MKQTTEPQTPAFDAIVADLAERAVLTGVYEVYRDEIDTQLSSRRVPASV